MLRLISGSITSRGELHLSCWMLKPHEECKFHLVEERNPATESPSRHDIAHQHTVKQADRRIMGALETVRAVHVQRACQKLP